MSTVAAITFSLVIRRLCMKGTSSELRKKVITRHIAYFIIYIYMCLLNVVGFYIGFGAFEERYKIDTWIGLLEWK